MKDGMPQPKRPDKIHSMWEDDDEPNRAKYYGNVAAIATLGFGVACAATGAGISWWLFAGGCGG